MKISYDAEVDALSISFRETTVTTTHLAEGIAADYDSNGQLVGLEILDAVKRLCEQNVLRQVIIEGRRKALKEAICKLSSEEQYLLALSAKGLRLEDIASTAGISAAKVQRRQGKTLPELVQATCGFGTPIYTT
jgi:uncharacterized protein YuzE